MAPEPKRSNDISLLSAQFRLKFDLFRKEVIALRKDAVIFEAKRTKERQQRLRDESNRREKLWQPRITWTLQSKHLTGDAVDIVFMDDERTPQYDNKPSRVGPYDALIKIAKKYGIENLRPRETCHFQDNGYPLAEVQQVIIVTQENSKLRKKTTDIRVRARLNWENDYLRGVYGIE